MTILTFAAALGAALVSGIFFAFSTFIMRALGRLRPAEGIAAMQSINITVIHPTFLGAFFGTGILSAAVVISTWLRAEEGLELAILGTVLYIVGCLGVTIAGNIPLNDRLAKAEPEDAAAHELWNHYLSRWTLWNTVRTLASLAAAAVFVAAATA